MVQIGSSRTNKILLKNYAEWEQVEKNKEYKGEQSVKKIRASSLIDLKEVGKSGNLVEIVQTEQFLCAQELELYGRDDPDIRASLITAAKFFDDMMRLIEKVQSSETYKLVEEGLSFKKKQKGIPYDAFHEGVDSHIARLGNNMRVTGLPFERKNLFRQRQENMRIAKKIYISLQRKALGLPEQEQSRGLGR